MRTTRITIASIHVTRRQPDLNDELQYLGGALGLFGQRDKDKSRFRIFIALLKALRTPARGLTTDDLAAQLDLTRATVLHHLDSLLEAGIVEQHKGVYTLRVETLQELVDEIRGDVNRMLDDIHAVAQHCDAELGLKHPQPSGKNRTPY